jgi:uncharacterized membrane protein
MFAVDDGLFTQYGFEQLLRWAHVLFGIAWIGLLYFFNLVQVPAYAAFGDEAKARNIAIDKVTRRALWYFRWAAVATVVMGLLITIVTENYFSDGFGSSAKGLAISLGMLVAIVMFLNVWGVIWRNQKVVLANAANVIAGGEANPDAPASGRRAVMASRQNFIFSFGMLFLMIVAGHTIYSGGLVSDGISGAKVGTFWLINLVVIAVLEVNALGLMPWKTQANKGLNIIYDGPGVRNPIIAAVGYLVIVVILCELFLRA